MEKIYCNDKIDDLVETCFDRGQYRPTEVTILYKLDKESGFLSFLLLKSAKAVANGKDSWNFHQGGLERGKSLADAISRELNEELGIDAERDISYVCCGYHHANVDAAPGRQLRDGFSRGKCLIYSIAEYSGEGQFCMDSSEVADVSWDNYLGVFKMLLSSARPAKASVSMTALQQGLGYIKKSPSSKSTIYFP